MNQKFQRGRKSTGKKFLLRRNQVPFNIFLPRFSAQWKTFLIYYFWILIGKLLCNFSYCQWFSSAFCLTLKLDFSLSQLQWMKLMEIILCKVNYCIKLNLIYSGVYFVGFALTELWWKICRISIDLNWDSIEKFFTKLKRSVGENSSSHKRNALSIIAILASAMIVTKTSSDAETFFLLPILFIVYAFWMRGKRRKN